MEIITKDGYPCSLINANRKQIRIKTLPYMNRIGKFPPVKVSGNTVERILSPAAGFRKWRGF